MVPAQLTVLNPVATVQGDLRWFPLAPRVGQLSGKRVGLWWNLKRGGDLALQRVGETLQSRYPGVELVWYKELFPAPPAVIARAASECQVVVGTSGD